MVAQNIQIVISVKQNIYRIHFVIDDFNISPRQHVFLLGFATRRIVSESFQRWNVWSLFRLCCKNLLTLKHHRQWVAQLVRIYTEFAHEYIPVNMITSKLHQVCTPVKGALNLIILLT